MEITFKYKDGSEYVAKDDQFGDYASPGVAQKMMRLLDDVKDAGMPELNVYERASFVALNSRICRKCGCSEHNPCISAEGSCSWAEADLCSHCKAGIMKVYRPYGK
jgi:hypothetical protein